MSAIKPRGFAVIPSDERTFRIDEAKLAVMTAAADGLATIVSRDRGFAIVLTRHPLTREVTGDGFDLATEDDDKE